MEPALRTSGVNWYAVDSHKNCIHNTSAHLDRVRPGNLRACDNLACAGSPARRELGAKSGYEIKCGTHVQLTHHTAPTAAGSKPMT